MRYLPRRHLALTLLAGCTSAFATPTPADLAALPATELAALRGRGPVALTELLAAYDAAPRGLAKSALGLEVDAVAAQRYATVSRLYWYTDLPTAEAEAQRRHVPILSLRMLGRLDEDLSCANSRLFRSTLYANTEVATFLRDHFVLHWSTERAVPRVTIDFGDGRALERTTTGNSAHYVLDEHGRVLDVLPGVYAPVAFTHELRESLVRARQIAALPDADRAGAIAALQAGVVVAADTWRGKLGPAPIVDGKARLLGRADVRAAALSLAQMATASKARMEVPDLKRFGYAVTGPAEDDLAAWATAGQIVYGIGDLAAELPPEDAYGSAPPAPPAPASRTPVTAPHVLDVASRALIERLHDAVPAELVATRPQLAQMMDRLEQHVVADTAINQLRLRPLIAQHIVQTGGTESFEQLDTWVYAEVFKTPRSDAWLGLVPRTDFTGLPGDGIVTR